jgi:hypothetical protein
MYWAPIATGQEHQHARSLGIVGIILNHLRLAQGGDDFTDQYAVLGKFVITVVGYAKLTAIDKLTNLPKR